jgi:phage/plasmid-associated DNA primase
MAPSNIIFDEIKPSHRQEWLNSAVDESLIDANLHTISDHRTINHLLGWKTPKGAAGKQTKEDRTCWAVWGVNPQNLEAVHFGVQIKPDNPRNSLEGKPIKYESGLGKGEASQPLFLKVPDPIWEQIASKWAVPILPEDYEQGFWQWVINKPQIPLAITEGAKKAASMLSHGYATISVAGVSNGQYLGDVNPHIKPFCQVGRKVALAYDSDLHFKQSVRKELDRLGRLLATAGAVPYVMLWDEATKGIDDVISEFGASELDKIYSTAKTFEAYRREDFELDGKKEEEEIETDLHFNQVAIATIYKNERYICLNNELYKFTGKHYELSPDATEKRRITKFCSNYKFYDTKTRKYVYRYATERAVSNVLGWFKATTGVVPKEVNPNGLNLANGVLYIDWDGNTPTFVLKPHHPDIIFTYVSNVKYDPQADPHHCDRLLSSLIPEQREIVLRTLAASLSFAEVGARLPNRLRCLLMQGSGSNGKDTLRDAVTDIMGSIFVSNCTLSDFHSFEKGSDKFSLAPLARCKLNWSPENTDSLMLDKLETLKAVITGDPVRVRDLYEKAETVTAQFGLLFNVNRMPAISASQVAIKSRLAIITFTKTFKSDPDPNDPNQLKGDHRYKKDPKFRQENICSALLNRLLQSLSDVVAHGIDYSSCEEALQIARESSCHLTRWAKDISLTEGKGKIRIGDLFHNLKNWYVDNGILDIEETPTGKERLVWLDDGEKYDPFIKAPNRMRKAIEKIFPNATFSEKTEYGFFAIGINSPLFTVLPNFGSVGSAKEEDADTATVSTAEPNPEPNNFGSVLKSGSATIQKIQPEPDLIIPEPDLTFTESNKSGSASETSSMNGFISSAEPTEPKTGKTVKNKNSCAIESSQNLKIGDRVDILRYGQMCDKFPKVKPYPPDSGYQVTDIAENNGILQATIKHPSIRSSFVVPADWLMDSILVTA